MNEHVTPERPQSPKTQERPALSDAQERSWYRRPRLWLVLAAIGALLLLGYCTIGGGGAGEQEKAGGQPPSVVSVARARQMTWSEEVSAVGTLAAVQGVDVTTELPGIVRAISFTNGSDARRGQTLVLLDTSTERAQFAAQVAQRDQAKLAYDRALRLIRRGAIAEQDVEQARASWLTLAAQAEQTRTAIDKKRIEAPFAGALGIRQVSLGQFVGAGAAIVNLLQIAPINVNFELPEQSFPKIRVGQSIRLRVAAFGDRDFRGRINAINPGVAQQTRSVTVQAIVANADRALRPGMFTDVTVELPGVRNVVAVPISAVTANAYGESVFTVARPDPRRQQQEAARAKQAEEEKGGIFSRLFGGGGSDEKGGGGEASGKQAGEGQEGGPPQARYVARTTFVQTGERRGLMVEILKGLRPGAPVVTAGQLKLDDHAPITISRRDALQGARPRPRQP